jgi:hypothetical protein
MIHRRWLAWIVTAIGLAIVAAALAGRLRGPQAARTLEIEMRTSAGTTAQLYWDAGLGFSEENSIRLPLQRTPKDVQRLRFALPGRRPLGLRFDPTDAPAEVLLASARVLDATEKTIAVLDLSSLLPMNQVASMRRDPPAIQIVTNGNDPFLFVNVACLDGPVGRYSLTRVTPLSLTLVCLFVLALLGASLRKVATDWFRRDDTAPVGSEESRGLFALWIGALFLTSFSAKLLLMRYYPAPVPFEDQWWAEAGGLYVPFHDGCLSWRAMFALHNEHRVFFTRLLALGLLSVNGQWDPQLQQVVDAVIHAATAVILAGIFWVAAGRRRIDLISVIAGIVFTLPFSWENTLFGFQSAFYFLLLFTVLALWLTAHFPAGSRGWLIGWFCAFCSLFTSAGGLLTPVALLVPSAMRVLSNRRLWRELRLTLAAAAVVIAVGVASTAPPLPHHAPYKAGTLGAFATALARNGAWPWIDSPVFSVFMWLPLVVMVLLALRRDKPPTELERISCALGVWAVLQASALAYARGVGGGAPASRYMDLLSMGFVANGMAWLAIQDRLAGSLAKSRIAMGMLACWLGFALIGVTGLTEEALRTGAFTRRAWMEAFTRNVREFLSTDDVAAFTSRPFPFQVPYSNPLLLANGWLRDPYVRQILPPAIREPLRLTPASTAEGPFVSDGAYPTTPTDALRHSRGSYTNRGNPSMGRFESQPVLPCVRTAFLKFEVAGYLGQPGLSLRVKDVTSGREHNVLPRQLAKESWLNAHVSCPDEPFTIVAEDLTPDAWFAFRDPVEIGWASVAADWLIARARGLLLISLTLAYLAIRLT